MADFMNMFKQAQEMQGRFQTLQAELQGQKVVGSSGGGMVTVEANGHGHIQSVRIDPTIVNVDDLEMLEDLLLVAITDVQKKAQELAQGEMSKLTGGMNLPFKLPF